MAITFDTFPSYRRASMRAIELKGKKKSISGDYIPERVLIVGQFDPAKTSVVEGAAVQCLTADAVGDTFGYGFELHRQAIKIFDALGGYSDNVWCAAVPVPSSSAQATGTITFTGDATSAGTFFVSIAGELYQVGVVSGATDDEIAAALVALITADVAAPVTAAVGGTGSENIVTITAKDYGVNGNDIRLVLNPDGTSQSDQNPSGPTVALSAARLASGTGNPDVSSVFIASDDSDNLGDRWYTLITMPYRDSTAIASYKAALTARVAPEPNRVCGAVCGYVNKTYAEALAIPATINSKFIAPVWDSRSLAPDCEFGAAVLGMVAYYATLDPGRPFMGCEVGVASLEGLDPVYSQLDALFRAGMGYCKQLSDGTLVAGDLALSYRTNTAGAATEEWYDIVSLTRRQVMTYQMEQVFKSDPYIRGMVGSDDIVTSKDYVIKPKTVVSDLYRLVDNWASEGWVKNPDDIKATISAEINASNESRIDATITSDEAKALRIIALQAAFLY